MAPVWKDLPLEQQARLAHILAVLVRRTRQQPKVQDAHDDRLD
jgi:hypothetical protein